MEMNDARWAYTERYIHDLLGGEEPDLQRLVADARDAGLPDIAITAEVGRLLALLASTTPGRVALEVGTLGGYSASWLLRGLAPSGRLITLERDPRHARFAAEHLARMGAGARVEVRVGAALELLPRLALELGPGSVDVAFIDADKAEYLDYWSMIRPLLGPGAVFIADNALGSNAWWIDAEANPQRNGADALNRALARDPEFSCALVPARQGLLIARRYRLPALSSSSSG